MSRIHLTKPTPPCRRLRCLQALTIGTTLAAVAIGAARAALPTNAPAKATTIKVDLSRAYAPCTSPNTTHDPPLAVGACAPPQPLSAYSFGPRGSGRVAVKALGQGGLRVKVKLKDVRDAGDVPATASFAADLRFRWTSDGCGGAACTTIGFAPAPVPVTCAAGNCTGDVGMGVGPCSHSLESLRILDDAAAPFAEAGLNPMSGTPLARNDRSPLRRLLAAARALLDGALAYASHDVAFRASRLNYTLVRAYDACTAPNTTHDPPEIISACAPAVVPSTYNFGPKGKGTATLTRKGGPDLILTAKVTDVRGGQDVPATATFQARVVLRVTDDNCAGLACTAQDVGTLVALPCTAGKCAVKASLGGGIFGISTGPCSITLQDLEVRDDTGAVFAEPGVKVL